MLELLVGCGCGEEETLLVAVPRVRTPRPWLEQDFEAYPAVIRPTIRVPAIVAWQMGITSWSSASNTLRAALVS